MNSQEPERWRRLLRLLYSEFPAKLFIQSTCTKNQFCRAPQGLPHHTQQNFIIINIRLRGLKERRSPRKFLDSAPNFENVQRNISVVPFTNEVKTKADRSARSSHRSDGVQVTTQETHYRTTRTHISAVICLYFSSSCGADLARNLQ